MYQQLPLSLATSHLCLSSPQLCLLYHNRDCLHESQRASFYNLMDASLLWFLHKPVPHSFCYFSLFFRISYVDKMKYYPIHSSLPPINCSLVLLSILPLNLMYFFHNLLRLISVCHICKDVGLSTRWWKNYHWAHSQKKNGSHCNHNLPAAISCIQFPRKV